MVCRLVMGKSNGDSGDILGVSPHTVDTLVRRVFAKLGVTNCNSAALRAVGAFLAAGRGAPNAGEKIRGPSRFAALRPPPIDQLLAFIFRPFSSIKRVALA
jgi:hypothetical protein